MEEQNKYFCPDISELHVGYECKHTTCKGAFDINLEDDIVKDKLTVDDLRRYLRYCGIHGDDIKDYIKTRYLDQSDIESLGWAHIGGQMVSHGRQDYEKPGMMLKHFPRHNSLFIAKAINPDTMDGFAEKLFDGECKSINELRTIMKFLNIK